MRALAPFAALAFITGVTFTAAPGPAEAAPSGTAYFTFYEGEGLMGDVPVDAVLKETRQGGKVVSAVLDVCHSVSEDSDRKDRFVVTLKPQAGKLVGTTESQEDKLPVSVALTRKPTASGFDFAGTISRGSAKFDISSTDKTEQSEAEYRQAQTQPEAIEPAPKDFTEVAPDSLVAKVKRGSLAALVKALRGEDVEVGFDALAVGCDVLRSGEHVVRVDLDPERAPQLLSKLKSFPGVTAAGFGAGTYSMDGAMRFSAAGWLAADGTVDRSKLADVVGAIVAKSLSAKLRSAQWDKTTGDLDLKFARPDHTVPGLDLVQVVDVSVLVGPEKPGSRDNLVLWVGDVTAETVDEAAGPHLTFSGASIGGGGEDQPQLPDGDAPLTALAQALNGHTWDSDKSAWK